MRSDQSTFGRGHLGGRCAPSGHHLPLTELPARLLQNQVLKKHALWVGPQGRNPPQAWAAAQGLETLNASQDND